jgi:hypothetical protein
LDPPASDAPPPIGSTWQLGSVVRTTAVCRLFPLGEALPSTTSAGSCLPLFDRFLGSMASSDFSSTCMLGVRHLPSRAGPAKMPGVDETSRVPRKERLHVLKVFDCARFISCKPFAMRRCCLLVSALDRHLGIGPVSQLNTRPVVSPVNASRLASRTEPRASLGVGAVGYSLPREGLSPPILCQLVLALTAMGQLVSSSHGSFRQLRTCRNVDAGRQWAITGKIVTLR